ncbi:hypothetical protein C4B63_219g45 [Trypanosoma cruzi]|uniref:Uncharacterized protein n=1 Tax=Trypanosoma cruzi TaxID=5693 RepID=A0A2V2UKG5_TRYCR|nr:hypothetical protein C4B63_219g45 [Trypanosoma cruzi]
MASCSVTPEQELQIIQTILALRSLGDTTSSERLRQKVRRCLEESTGDEAAVATADQLLRRYKKIVKKLDGSYEMERELKMRRSEMEMRRASRFVDDEAESGDDDEDEDEDEEEDKRERSREEAAQRRRGDCHGGGTKSRSSEDNTAGCDMTCIHASCLFVCLLVVASACVFSVVACRASFSASLSMCFAPLLR